MINSGNPALKSGLAEKGIKKQSLLDLWIKGTVITWGQLAGISSRNKIRVYTRSDSCGAAETWAQYLGGKNQEDLKGVGVYGDPGLAEAVRKDVYRIGYNNLNYAYDFKTGLPLNGLFVIPIDVNENGRIDPGENLKTKRPGHSGGLFGNLSVASGKGSLPRHKRGTERPSETIHSVDLSGGPELC